MGIGLRVAVGAGREGVTTIMGGVAVGIGVTAGLGVLVGRGVGVS